MKITSPRSGQLSNGLDGHDGEQLRPDLPREREALSLKPTGRRVVALPERHDPQAAERDGDAVREPGVKRVATSN